MNQITYQTHHSGDLASSRGLTVPLSSSLLYCLCYKYISQQTSLMECQTWLMLTPYSESFRSKQKQVKTLEMPQTMLAVKITETRLMESIMVMPRMLMIPPSPQLWPIITPTRVGRLIVRKIPDVNMKNLSFLTTSQRDRLSQQRTAAFWADLVRLSPVIGISDTPKWFRVWTISLKERKQFPTFCIVLAKQPLPSDRSTMMESTLAIGWVREAQMMEPKWYLDSHLIPIALEVIWVEKYQKSALLEIRNTMIWQNIRRKMRQMTPIRAISAEAVSLEYLLAACSCIMAAQNPIRKKEKMSPTAPMVRGTENILEEDFRNYTPSSKIVRVDFKWDRNEQNRLNANIPSPIRVRVPIT